VSDPRPQQVNGLLLRHHRPDVAPTLAGYRSDGGGVGLEKARAMDPRDVINEVKTSGLRGRGGAGFPTGLKWGFIPRDGEGPRYVVCNADEGEPGTFKDRDILRFDPFRLLEGLAIAGHAIGAQLGFIYIRGEYLFEAQVVGRAIEEARAGGMFGECFDVLIYRGAGAYICGEETALLNSLEGKKGQPRLKPPFPATSGLYGRPTLVNNVETLTCLPDIMAFGGEWYAGIGTPKNSGTKIFSLSGHVRRPGNYELPLGTTLRTLVEDCGQGVLDGRNVQAIIPGGGSAPMLTAAHLDTPMTYDDMTRLGTMLGSGGVVVISDSACIVGAVTRLAKFYAHESCGQCVPCREGTGWMARLLARIEAGMGSEEDLENLERLTGMVPGITICALSDAAVGPVKSALTYFRSAFERHVREHSCPQRRAAGGR